MLSNWAQLWLLLHYLSIMDEDQTLVLYSGHPMGLFPSHPMAPRCVISNGMVCVMLVWLCVWGLSLPPNGPTLCDLQWNGVCSVGVVVCGGFPSHTMAPRCVISNGMVCVMLVWLCVGGFSLFSN